MLPALLRTRPFATMLRPAATRRILRPVVRHPAVLALNHPAQFLHLPRERLNLTVHRLHRRTRTRSRPALRRRPRMPRHSAPVLTRRTGCPR
jgi:hypothetical protein